MKIIHYTWRKDTISQGKVRINTWRRSRKRSNSGTNHMTFTPLIIGMDLLIGKGWPSHVLLTACGISLLGGDTCSWDECTAAAINPVWEALRSRRNPNLCCKMSHCCLIPSVPPCSQIQQQYQSTMTLCIRLTLYYITYDAGFKYINRTGTNGVPLHFLQGQKLNPASLSVQIQRLCMSPVSPATARGFNDNKEIRQLGRW